MMKKSDFYVGVPIFNRMALLQLLIPNWERAGLLTKSEGGCQFCLFDDASTEFSGEVIQQLFKPYCNVTYYRNPINLKADKNLYTIFTNFLQSDKKALFISDSDLLISPRMMDFVCTHFEKTDGVLTVFNTINSHPAIAIVDNCFVLKEHVGAAGCIISRQRVEQFLKKFSHIQMVEGIDWQFSAYFNEEGIKILSTLNSFAQHLGFSGQNSSSLSGDYGANFVIEDPKDGQILNDAIFNAQDHFKNSGYVEIRNLLHSLVTKRKRRKDWFKRLITKIRNCF